MIALQTNALKAFFKTDDIDRKDSFLHSFIRGYTIIVAPIVRTSGHDQDYHSHGRADQVEVEETVSFTAGEWEIKSRTRLSGLKLAAQVKQMSILKYDIEIQVPARVCGLEFRQRHPNVTLQRRVFKSTDTPNQLLYQGPGIGFALGLKDYEGVDIFM